MLNQLSLPGGALNTESRRVCRRCLLYLVILAVALSFIGMPVQAAAADSGQASGVNSVSYGEGPIHADHNETKTTTTVATENTQAAYNYATEGNADIFGIPTEQYQREEITVERTDDRGRDISTYGPLEEDESGSGDNDDDQ